MENILVRGANWLGDAVMSTAALQRLREAKPGARISLLCPEKLAGLWAGQPWVDDVLTFNESDSAWQTGRRLRAKGFSLGIAFPNSFRSALELWLARIPQRVWLARGGRSFLLTNPVAPRKDAVRMVKRSAGDVRRLVREGKGPIPISSTSHHVHDYLHLVSAVGASSVPLPPRIVINRDEVDKVAARLGLPSAREDRPFFGLNPGAEYGPAKRWPTGDFIAAAVAVHKATRCRWIIFGGEGDREIAHVVATGIGQVLAEQPVINLAGQTTLRELAAALKSCRLLLTNDTGPMHLAAAVGTPVVAVFGSTSPEMTGPIFSADAQIVRAPDIPCAPCFLRTCPIDFRCMTRIESDVVVKAVLRLASS